MPDASRLRILFSRSVEGRQTGHVCRAL